MPQTQIKAPIQVENGVSKNHNNGINGKSFELNGKSHVASTNGAEKPKILQNVLQAIGNTPMIKLNRIPQSMGVNCDVYVKCEFLSAGGSHKDRIALRMIEEAEKDGRIQPGCTIIEPTSGNTGIGVAMVAAVKGYKCILVMPEKMSAEKQDTMQALGATIIRTPGCLPEAPESFISVAKRLNKEITNSIILDQYGNEDNPGAHYDHTGQEILDQCDGKLDMLVMGVGTGGIITGLGRRMKDSCKSCVVVGVDPEGSIMAEPESLNQTETNFWEIEGIGHDWLPDVLDRSVVDKWVKCTDKESLQMARRIIQEEGLLIGGSCGSAVSGAMTAIKEAGLKEGQRCVIILPDSIRNYMTKFLSNTWMWERGFLAETDVQLQYPWWNSTVSELHLSKPTAVNPDTTIADAIKIMEGEVTQFLPVVQSDGTIKGVVTLNALLAKMLNAKVQPKDSVSSIMHKQLKKVTAGTKLGKLSFILQGNQYALVVETVKSGQNEIKEVITGVATQMDLIKFSTSS